MILVATGLLREARIIARPGIEVIAGGSDAARLERELDTAAPGAVALVSMGLAGALVERLAPGDWVVDCADDRWRTGLRAAVPSARPGAVVGSAAAVATPEAKRALHLASGALAVDMESAVAARVAVRHGLRFAALRVISDGVDDALPPAAIAGMRSDGAIDLAAVLASLARHPGQLPALIRTGRLAETGFRALRSAVAAGWPLAPQLQ